MLEPWTVASSSTKRHRFAIKQGKSRGRLRLPWRHYKHLAPSSSRRCERELGFIRTLLTFFTSQQQSPKEKKPAKTLKDKKKARSGERPPPHKRQPRRKSWGRQEAETPSWAAGKVPQQVRKPGTQREAERNSKILKT